MTARATLTQSDLDRAVKAAAKAHMAVKSPYLLPEGNVQIAFSGGRTSAYMLRQILDANPGVIGTDSRVQVTFQNTGREMPETLDFVREVGARWGVPVVWLEYLPHAPFFQIVSHNSAARNGEPFDALIDKKQYLPNQQSRFCTVELKIRTAKRFLVGGGWKRWTNCVGLRADEPERLVNLPRTWTPKGVWVAEEVKGEPKRVWVGEPRAKDRWIVWTPLADAGVSRHDIATFWRDQPFDLRLPNVGGNCWLGNCDGCFLKSEAHVASLAREFPERAAWWEAAEARIGALETSKGRPKDNAQFSKRYSRAEMRDFMDRQGDNFDQLTQLGILCQTDDGECTG
jgi:3'-phosphoadenosine 5'-phosphosulfate sulfotransferase (PAPS reductase)/FAD synthetase